MFHHVVGCENVLEEVFECVNANQSFGYARIDQDAVVFGAIDDVEVIERVVVVVDLVLW